MGFLYEGKKLCCDSCGVAGGVRKRRCPLGYCPSAALCPSCYKAKGNWKKYHERCIKPAAEYKAKRETEAVLLASGFELRCAAKGEGDGTVHVLFRNKYGATTGYRMTKTTYDAIPLLALATPEMFKEFGTLTPAAPDFNY